MSPETVNPETVIRICLGSAIIMIALLTWIETRPGKGS